VGCWGQVFFWVFDFFGGGWRCCGFVVVVGGVFFFLERGAVCGLWLWLWLWVYGPFFYTPLAWRLPSNRKRVPPRPRTAPTHVFIYTYTMHNAHAPTSTHTHTQQATARLTATLDGRLVREATLGRVAFELGAGLLCNGTCSGSGTAPSSVWQWDGSREE
jgi:hypothetical protein